MVYQPEHRKTAEMVREAVKEHADVFIADRPVAFCSQCGQAITLPIPEMMDPERTKWAEVAKWLEGLEDGSISPSRSSKEELEDLFGKMNEDHKKPSTGQEPPEDESY